MPIPLEEKHEPVSDIDTEAVDSLKVLDPNRPIREATEPLHYSKRHQGQTCRLARDILRIIEVGMALVGTGKWQSASDGDNTCTASSTVLSAHPGA